MQAVHVRDVGYGEDYALCGVALFNADPRDRTTPIPQALDILPGLLLGRAFDYTAITCTDCAGHLTARLLIDSADTEVAGEENDDDWDY